MAECPNCASERVQFNVCLDCGFQTAEKAQTLETTARKRAARKTTVEKR